MAFESQGDDPYGPRFRFALQFGGSWIEVHSLEDAYRGYNISPYNQSWIHLAGVWDRDGIDGSGDTMHPYLDGEVVATATDNTWGSTVGCQVDICGGNDAEIAFKFYMDNLIVWDYAKTDFSDRFTESPFPELERCESAIMTASDGEANDSFGFRVATDGDRIVVGAAYDDHAGGTEAGSAYVFVRSSGIWTQQAQLIAADAAPQDYFGISVALDGDGDTDLTDLAAQLAGYGTTCKHFPPNMREARPPETAYRWRRVLVTSPSDGEYPTSVDPQHPSRNVLTFGRDDTYAYGRWGAASHFYRRTLDSDTWLRIFSHQGGEPHFRRQWVLPDSSILAYCHDEKKLYHSANPNNHGNGRLDGTFVEVMGAPGQPEFSPNGWPTWFSLAVGPAGSVLLVEYGAAVPGSGNRMFWSGDNGRTWEQIWDQLTDGDWSGEDCYRHHHTALYVPALNKFVVSTGDVQNHRRTLQVDSTTNDVTTLIEPGNNFFQPVAMTLIDDGGEEILFGSDGPMQLSILNARTGEHNIVWRGFDDRPLRGCCWAVWKHNGLYYAGQYYEYKNPSQPLNRQITEEAVLLVARNPRGPWGVYHRFVPDYGASDGSEARQRGVCGYAGYINGKLVMNAAREVGNTEFRISPATVRELDAVVAEPASENLVSWATIEYDNPCTSPDVPPWFAGPSDGVHTYLPAGGVFGGRARCWVTNGDRTVDVLQWSRTYGCLADRTYTISWYMKCEQHTAISVGLLPGHSAVDDGSTLRGVFLNASEWVHITAPVFTPLESAIPQPDEGTIGLAWRQSAQTNNQHRVYYISNVQVQKGVGTRAIKGDGARREADIVDVRYDVADRWTEVFYFAPELSTFLLASGEYGWESASRLYIRSYELGAAAARLFWEPTVRGTVARVSQEGDTGILALTDLEVNTDMIGLTICTRNENAGPSGQYAFNTWLIEDVDEPNNVVYVRQHESNSEERVGDGAPGSVVENGARASVAICRFGLHASGADGEEVIYSGRHTMVNYSPAIFAVALGGDASDGQTDYSVRAFVINGSAIDEFTRLHTSGPNKDARDLSKPGTETGYEDLGTGLLLVRAGNPTEDDRAGFPGAYAVPGMDAYLSDDQIKAATAIGGDVVAVGDLDGDCDVDLVDLAILLAHYGMTEGATYEDGDLDADADVDLSDLAALLAVYGTACP